MRASSESEHSGGSGVSAGGRADAFDRSCAFLLTGVDEELIGNAGVVDVVDGCREQSGEDLQVSEDGLRETKGFTYSRPQKRALSFSAYTVKAPSGKRAIFNNDQVFSFVPIGSLNLLPVDLTPCEVTLCFLLSTLP